MDISELWHGFVRIDTLISLSLNYYNGYIHIYVKINTWISLVFTCICQKFSSLSKCMCSACICITCISLSFPNQTKPKFDQDLRPGQNSGRWLTWNICNGLLSRYYEFLAIEYWVLIENPFALNTLEPKPFQPNFWALAKEHITGGARGGGLPQYSIVNGGPLDPYPRTPSTLPPLSYH